jgi:peptide deformylase
VSIRNIVQWPNRILTTPAKLVPAEDVESERIAKLAQDLIDTCTAVEGLGLAAPQIGVGEHVAVLNLDHLIEPISEEDELPGYLVMINPHVVLAEGDQRLMEGCLSVPGEQAWVQRPAVVTVEYTDLQGESFTISGQRLMAVALQHEVDHLNGIVYTSYLPQFKRSILRRRQVRLRKKFRKAGFTGIPVPGASIGEGDVETA